MNDFTFFTELKQSVDHLIGLIESKSEAPAKIRKPMTLTEAADYLNLTKQGVYNRVHLNTIPFHKNGKLFFFQDELDAFINGTWKPSRKK